MKKEETISKYTTNLTQKNKTRIRKKQVIVYLNDNELEYLDMIYQRKFFPSRASYIRKLLAEDRDNTGF